MIIQSPGNDVSTQDVAIDAVGGLVRHDPSLIKTRAHDEIGWRNCWTGVVPVLENLSYRRV